MSYRFRLQTLLAGAAITLLGTGCARHHLNAPLEIPDPDHGYRFRNLSHEGNSDEVFVCLTFSGGGGRASALSYGVLQQLRDTEIMVNGERRRLLDEVDVISSVSGGSFTSAHFALHGDAIFENFEDDFLHQNYQRKIALSALNPVQWFRFMSPNFGLSDRAAEIYDTLYDGATYGDLAQGDRPYIIINATDITQGRPFQFTQDQFDYLQSDLSSIPLTRAVTSSSAVPVILSPLVFRSYHHQTDFELPDWVSQQFNAPDFPSVDWQQASQLLYYTDPEKCEYVHLIDGGITDNLAVHPLVLPSREGEPNDLSIGQMVDLDAVEDALFITVNAANRPDTDWTLNSNPPGAFAVLGRAIAGLMSNTSVTASRYVRQRALGTEDRLEEEGYKGVEIWLVDIGFANLPDEEERSFFQNVASSLALSTETYDRLIRVGAELLVENPEFQEFVARRDGAVTPVESTTPSDEE